MNNCDVLIYAEDPGAANYVAHLSTALAASNVKAILVTDGLATDYLKQRGVISQPLETKETAAYLVDYYKPRLIIVGTSENAASLGLKLIRQAKTSGIISAAVIDLPVNADRRFRGDSANALEYAPDWLLVPDLNTKDAYIQLGFNANKIIACGHPHYDHIRQKAEDLRKSDQLALRNRILPGVPQKSPIVVFVAEPASKLNPALSVRLPDYTMLGRGDSNWRTEIILQEFLDAFSTLKPAPYLVLRLHPKNNKDEFKDYQKKIDFFSVGGDPLELISVANLVVGMTSSLLQEALLMDKPTLSILPLASEKSQLSSLASGLTPAVSTRADLQKFVSQWIDNWSANSSAKTKASDTKTIFPPGSLQRVVDFIIGLTKNVSV